MKKVFLCLMPLLVISNYANAGIFGPSNYEECIDDIVKNSKIKEALDLGERNCYEKFIRPIQNKMEQNAEKKAYRKATRHEIENLKCERNAGPTYNLIACEIQNYRMDKIYKMKMSTGYQDGKILDIEFQNYAPGGKWKNEKLNAIGDNVKRLNKQTLEIKPIE